MISLIHFYVVCHHHHVAITDLSHLLAGPVSHIQKSFEWSPLFASAF